MNRNFCLSVFAAIITCVSAAEIRSETWRLESNLYVFKSDAAVSADLPDGEHVAPEEATGIHAPATLAIGRTKLALAGATYTWDRDGVSAQQLTEMKLPLVIAQSGVPVAIHSSVPVEYMEKAADGSLQLHTIAKGAPDAPHCHITYTVLSLESGRAEIGVTCQLELATVAARKPVPGVALPVGRPVLTRFDQEVRFEPRPGEWMARLFQPQNNSEYGLLLLLRVTPDSKTTPVIATRGLMNTEQISAFAVGYYRDPHPELIGRAIQSLGPTSFLDRGTLRATFFHQDAYTCVGFFSEVFTANPDRVPEWRQLIEQAKDSNTRFWLGKALALRRKDPSRPLREKDLGSLERIEEVYVFWGAFLASGNTAYVRTLVDRLDLLNDTDPLFAAGAQSALLLAANVHQQPLIQEALAAARPNARADTREVIDILLHKDYAAMMRKIREKDVSDGTHISGAHSGNYYEWRQPLN
jgi:hypothetical protein